jgi:KDO2-lipid IV(A) lauroyltransferase
MADAIEKKGAGIGDHAQALLMRGLYRLIPRLPLRASYFIARALSALLVRLLTRQRKTVLGNLEVAFGSSLGEDEKNRIARSMADNMIKSFFECLYLASPFHGRIEGGAVLEGKEHLDRALARGKGVIAVSAHFGNFINLGSFMVRAHYPFHMVLRDPPSEPIARVFRFFRRKAGQQWISTTPSAQCQRRILSSLRSNGIICIIADEYRRHGGIPVDFFGHPVPTAAGPALLSLRTGAALLPLFVVRQQDDTHRVVIDPPLAYEPTGNRDADIRNLTALFTERIEHYVRRYPAQWWWTNRRWRGISRGDKHYRG